MKRVEYLILPRMVALSEIAWVQPEAKPNLEEFYRQLVPHFKRMDVMGLNYRVPDLEGFYQVNAFLDETSVDLTCPLPGIEVRYTTDGSMPTIYSLRRQSESDGNDRFYFPYLPSRRFSFGCSTYSVCQSSLCRSGNGPDFSESRIESCMA